MKYFFVFSLLLYGAFGQAQAERTASQSFAAAAVNIIKIDITDPYKIEFYTGTDIKVVTHIKMENGSEQTLDFAMDNDRYALFIEKQNNELILKSKEPARKVLRSKAGEIKEQITIVFMIPNEYIAKSTEGKIFVKKSSQLEASNR